MANNYVTVVSSYKPLDGQDHRSSVNFTTEDMQQKSVGGSMIMLGIYAYYNYEEKGEAEPAYDVTFDIKVDKSGEDPTFLKGVKNGTFVQNTSHRNLYIANPAGTDKEFTVVVKSEVGILSEPTHMTDQKNRSSENFSMEQLTSKKLNVRAFWNYGAKNEEEAGKDDIYFKIMKDKKGKDGVIAEKIYPGTFTLNNWLEDALYIANPVVSKTGREKDNFTVVFEESK